MAMPSTEPRWGDVGGAIVIPTSGKKDRGFAPKEKPPAQFLNWLFNLIWQWIVYFKGRFSAEISALDYATGDGTTDDSAGIQAAETAARAAGKTLYFPPGIYRIGSEITIGTNTHWRAAPGTATIKHL